MDHYYTCEQCGTGATLCVSDWGYIAALCDQCLKERSNYLKLPGPSRGDALAQPESAPAPAAM
ncbi:MAG: hypothetical protein V7640_992 [Betaproteobacteria bacterium]|jgi:hypothetical protein